jgi:DNA-binding transcriptional regulator YhcF (GntR family)
MLRINNYSYKEGGYSLQINFESEKPIFLQIAEGIEDAILAGAFPEESQIPSITEFSVNYKINPATALKGINILVDNGIVYKKRGLGMFVKTGAVDQLLRKRKEQFFDSYIVNLVTEATRLNLSEEDIKSMIERGFRK